MVFRGVRDDLDEGLPDAVRATISSMFELRVKTRIRPSLARSSGTGLERKPSANGFHRVTAEGVVP